MLKSWRGRGWEIFCFLVFFALTGYQVFIPPVTGLANNSDFVYVLGKFSICPVDREKQDNIYLVTDYFVDPVQCTWDIGLVSIELPLTLAATNLSAPFTGENRFDLRALAAIHLLFLLIAFGVLLSFTCRAGPAIRYGIPILAILIFTDVAYICYLNSVYLDAPALVLLLATAAFAAAACLNPTSRWIAAGYVICGVALVFVKSQHAILGLVFAALAVVLAFRPVKRAVRIGWAVVAITLVVSTIVMFSVTPRQYRLFPLYSVIFGRLAPHSDAPWDVLKEVGLGEDDLKYLNTHAYVPGAPVYNDAWATDFLRRTSYGKLMWFYLRNPDVAFSEMNHDLTHAAPVLRPTDMANYREKDGFPPRTMASRFSLWSTLRSASMRVFPYQLVMIYLAPWGYWLAAWKRPRLRTPLMPLALSLSVAGVMEFLLSTLTDALDTSRHLFIFQVITELMILLIAAAVLHLASERRESRLPSREGVIKSEA
jgi:energy-converting hydrogenase Eha subunit E